MRKDLEIMRELEITGKYLKYLKETKRYNKIKKREMYKRLLFIERTYVLFPNAWTRLIILKYKIKNNK